MEITDLLAKAGNLMLIGMVVVFAFLGMLVWLTKLMSSTVMHYQKRTTLPTALPQDTVPPSGGEIPQQTVAAITAAIHQYRQPKK
jgi:oxaloacetate decarboxylase gamma subunit